jgi:hypothetical protein
MDHGIAVVVADGLPLFGDMAAGDRLDVVEGVDPLRGGFDNRGVAALGDLVKPAPDVRPAMGERHRPIGTPGGAAARGI